MGITTSLRQCFPCDCVGDIQPFVDLSANQILHQTSCSAGSTKGGIQKTLSFTFSWSCVICSTFPCKRTSKCLLCMTSVKVWSATGVTSKPEGVKAGSQQAEIGISRSRGIFLAAQQLGFTLLELGWGEKQVSPVIPRAQSRCTHNTNLHGQSWFTVCNAAVPMEKGPKWQSGLRGCVEAPAGVTTIWETYRKLTRAPSAWRVKKFSGNKAQRKSLRN